MYGNVEKMITPTMFQKENTKIPTNFTTQNPNQVLMEVKAIETAINFKLSSERENVCLIFAWVLGFKSLEDPTECSVRYCRFNQFSICTSTNKMMDSINN